MMEDRSDRLYPLRPLVGVGAVVWDGARILLERRGRPPAEGAWSLPGGLVELGETAVAAVQREIREECAIEVEVGPLIGLFEPIVAEADGRVRYHYVVLDFLVYYRSGELTAGDDAAALRWVSPPEVCSYVLNPATLEMIDRALAAIHSRDRWRTHLSQD